MADPVLPTVFSALALLSAVAELAAFYAMAPPWFQRLPFPLRQAVELPVVADPRLLEGLDGTTDDAVWRYVPAARSVFFRRRLRLGGRRVMAAGRIDFPEDGPAVVRWAPFPFLLWPLLVLSGLVQAAFAGVTGDAAGVLPALGMAGVMVLAGGINLFMARARVRDALLPAVELDILDHLRSRDREPAPGAARQDGAVEGARIVE